MIVTGIQIQGSSGIAHEAVYGPLGLDPYIHRGLSSPPDFVLNSLGLRSSSSYALKAASRVILIHARRQKFLQGMEARDDLDPVVRAALPALRACMPAGVLFSEKRVPRYCRKYAVCPWCRFRKAAEIAGKLLELKSGARQMAFITLTLPVPLIALAAETFRDDHRELLNILCKKKRLFHASQVVSVPNWRSSGERWTFHIQTTVMGLMAQTGELPLPEDCLSAERRARMMTAGTGAGTWSLHRPTKGMITEALRQAMGFSPSLLAKNISAAEFRSALDLQSEFRAVGHGGLR